RISTPAIVCAASIASRIDRTVQSMLLTMPLRSPRHGTDPTPRIVIPSSAISPTTAHTLVVPMSRPTTISPCEAIVLIAIDGSHTRARRAKFYARGPPRSACGLHGGVGKEDPVSFTASIHSASLTGVGVLLIGGWIVACSGSGSDHSPTQPPHGTSSPSDG